MFIAHARSIKRMTLESNREAVEAFQNTGINVTTEGRLHIGAALGSRAFLED